MGYVTNRRGIYRTGFRPINATDTFAAAQLDGFSSASPLGRTPFDPERLGQYHPFTPGGGWRLHGLGDIVPNGSLVTYTGQWQLTNVATQNPSELLAAVIAAVNADGLHVVRSSSNAGFWDTEVLGNTFSVTLQIQVANGMGFGEPSDIGSIVDHEVYAASGAMPSGSGVSVVTVPGSTPGLPPPAAPSTDWSAWLQQNALWLGLGLVGLIVLPALAERIL